MTLEKRIEQRAREIAEQFNQSMVEMIKEVFGNDKGHTNQDQVKGDDDLSQYLGDDCVVQRKSLLEDNEPSDLLKLYKEIKDFRNQVEDIPAISNGIGYPRDVVEKAKSLLHRLEQYPDYSPHVHEAIQIHNLNSDADTEVTVSRGGVFIPHSSHSPENISLTLTNNFTKAAHTAISENDKFFQEQVLDYADEVQLVIHAHEKNDHAADMLSDMVTIAKQSVSSFVHENKGAKEDTADSNVVYYSLKERIADVRRKASTYFSQPVYVGAPVYLLLTVDDLATDIKKAGLPDDREIKLMWLLRSGFQVTNHTNPVHIYHAPIRRVGVAPNGMYYHAYGDDTKPSVGATVSAYSLAVRDIENLADAKDKKRVIETLKHHYDNVLQYIDAQDDGTIDASYLRNQIMSDYLIVKDAQASL